MTATREQIVAGLNAVLAMAEAIRELGQVPSGDLYARVMSHMDLEAYNRAITILKGSGIVREDSSHMLVWTGGGR